MLHRFKKYLEAEETHEVSEIPSEWFDFYNKLLTCHQHESKCRLLLAQIIETSGRLCEIDPKPCKSIKIVGDSLYFSISDIPNDDIVCEQKACMQIIHEYAMSRDNAFLVFDFSTFSSTCFFMLMKKATRYNMIDGYRLWSTIPCNVKKITVIKTNSLIWDTIFSFGCSLITDKLKKRIIVKNIG
tara:strand:+ start:6613 stop:7167 length:555 start_codon:yes stop_codon:yes gene_type:complete